MGAIKIEDVSHIRFAAPELATMQRFLEEFGLTKHHDDAQTIFMRAHGPAPFVHATQIGDAGFVALGLRAACVEDLEKLGHARRWTCCAPDRPGRAPG